MRQAADGAGLSQSLERGLAILSAFTPNRPALGISELAPELALTRSTTHRYVATLASLGYLGQDHSTRKYRLGPRVLDLGFSVLGSLELREIAAPHLRRLTDATGLTSNLGIRDDPDRLLERIDLVQRGPRTLTDRSALLAELEQVRRTGIAVNDEELDSALRAIAAPVRSRSGEVVAAVNVAIPWSPVAMTELAGRLGPVLRATANEIAARVI